MDRQFLLVPLLLSVCTSFGTAELQPSGASQRTQCNFQDHTEVTIEYEEMRMNGRKIFGNLVPYGKTWVMGRQSPSFVTSANLIIGGKEVPAGHYRLTTLPDPTKWIMVVKKMPRKESHDATDEVARIDLLVRRLPAPLESFTISFDQLKGGCMLKLRWEETEASVLLADNKQAPSPNQ